MEVKFQLIFSIYQMKFDSDVSLLINLENLEHIIQLVQLTWPMYMNASMIQVVREPYRLVYIHIRIRDHEQE